MSYDLYLRDPATHEELQVPAHMMHGGNIPCEVINGQFIPTTTTRAYLNVTYNYAHYYYEAFPSPEDENTSVQYKKDAQTFGIVSLEGGIRSLNGLSGLKAVPLLHEMINRIEKKYKKPDGTWLVTKREEPYVYEKSTGKKLDSMAIWNAYSKYSHLGYSHDEAERLTNEQYEQRTEIVEVNEGTNGGSYWTATAANAIRPLYQLITLSQMRPDGIWSEES